MFLLLCEPNKKPVKQTVTVIPRMLKILDLKICDPGTQDLKMSHQIRRYKFPCKYIFLQFLYGLLCITYEAV